MADYLYNVRVSEFETGLCELEFKALFGFELRDKIFITDKLVNPSISPYIKNRLKIIYKASCLDGIVKYITNDNVLADDFVVKYVQLYKQDDNFKLRKEICKKVGYVITGEPNFKEPKIKFGILYFNNEWYFGFLEENNTKWRLHNNKPHSYSSSLGINVAKAILNIGTKGNQEKTIIDPCCGVGTVLLEGYFSGYNICGWEINKKVAWNSRENLEHFDYPVDVTIGDIKDVQEKYDLAIVDLPYGNFSLATKGQQVNIIRHAKRISKSMILISSEDIKGTLDDLSLKTVDTCQINKRINKRFIRYVWVCEVV